jgi:adhesin/invasin
VATLYIVSSNAGPSTITAYVTNGPTTSRAVNFVATTPATIALQASPSLIGPNDGSETNPQQSVITAVVRDAGNNLVKGKSVHFVIQNDSSGGDLTTSTAVTDELGRASTAYVSSAATTAQNGVVIRATVDNTSITTTVSLTVSRNALFVRLGTGNNIDDVGETQYNKKYTVMVTDASGNAVQGAKINVSLNPEGYAKGHYVDNGSNQWTVSYSATTPSICPSEDINQNGILDPGEDKNIDGKPDPGKDTNNNGVLDVGEEDLGDGKLTPGNVVSVPSSITTGADGTFEFDVIYAQTYANWVLVRLTASTTVAGTESSDSVVFLLPPAADDMNTTTKAPPGGNLNSPFGTSASCLDAF